MSLSARMGRHSVIYAISIFAGQALGFLLIPLYTRALQPGEYGVMEILSRTSELMGIVLLAGLRMAVIRFVQDPRYRDQRPAVVGSAFITVLGPAGLMLALLFWQAGPAASLLLRNPGLGWAVRLMAGGSLCELATILPMALLQADQRSARFATLSLGRFLTGLGLNLALVAVLHYGLKGVLLSTLLSTGSFALLLMLDAVRRERPRLERPVLAELLRFGLPFVPGGLFLFVLNNGDRYFLARMTTPAELGLYALAYRMGSVVLFLTIQPIIMNWSATMVEIAARPDGKAVFARALTLVSGLYLACSAALALLCADLLHFVAGRDYQAASGLVPWIALAYFFYMSSMFLDTPFYLARKTGAKPVILGVSAAVNLALYAIMIPRWRAYGAAWATVLSFALFALLTWRVARRHLDVPYAWGRIGVMLAGSVVLVALGLWVPVSLRALGVAVHLAAALGTGILIWLVGFGAEERATATRAARGLLGRISEARHGV